MLDLAEFAAPVVEKLPLEGEFVFTRESVPEPPDELATTELGYGGHHANVYYGQVRYDTVTIAGPPAAFATSVSWSSPPSCTSAMSSCTPSDRCVTTSDQGPDNTRSAGCASRANSRTSSRARALSTEW